MAGMYGTIRPIPTLYRGVLWRSLVEARWAAFLDLAGINWQPEPLGFVLPGGRKYCPDLFLPDVWHAGEQGAYLECKGMASGEASQLAADVASSTGKPVLLAAGAIGSAGAVLRLYTQADGDVGVAFLLYCARCDLHEANAAAPVCTRCGAVAEALNVIGAPAYQAALALHWDTIGTGRALRGAEISAQTPFSTGGAGR